ncbi:T9SS type A sorting domain-containing protein [bacterium]|nr:T9SS type A sorting domain-containing protein [bacterium]
MNTKILTSLIWLSVFSAVALYGAKNPVDIAHRHNNEEAPATAYNRLDDQFLVVWHEDRGLGNGTDIYGRIVSSSGILVTEAFQITDTPEAQLNPDVDYNRIDNEYLVVWQDERNGNSDIMGARISATGEKIYPEITHRNESDWTIIISNQEDKQIRAKVAHNYTDNCYLVVWEDHRYITEDPVMNTDIYSQRIDHEGEILAPSITLQPSVNYPVASEMVPLGQDYVYAKESHPDVAYHGSDETELNEWLVVFERYTTQTGSRIWGTRISGWGGYHLNSFGEEFSKVDESGMAKKSSTTGSIFWLPFWCEGMPIGFPELPTNPDAPFQGYAGQYCPHVISNSVWFADGLLKPSADINENYPVPEFLVVWTDYRDSEMAENTDIYGQRIAYFPDDTAVRMGLKTEAGADSQFTAVLLDSLGNPPAVATNWIEWTNYAVTSHPNYQSWNDLAFNQNTGEYLVIWNDWRVTQWDATTAVGPDPQADLYAQRLYINPVDSHLVWIDADGNWYADPAVNMPIVQTENDEGDMMYPGIDCGVMQNEFLIAYEFDSGPTDANVDIQASFYPDEYVGSLVEDKPAVAIGRFSLSSNYPNPFNPSTTIAFYLSARADVKVRILDLQGRTVTVLMDSSMPAGAHTVQWNGRNSDGMEAASGIYMYCIQSGKQVRSAKMMLMK